ncbi:MAG: hypothetical protein HY209_06650, partial [Candidatus Omnitrophica bacterium]|nr:hypothetical protein [Candidatus Omnitrophota bacterium]
AFNSSPYSSWAPPNDGITNDAKSAKIQITEVNNSVVNTVSDGFEVEGLIRIDAPNTSGLIWTVGSTQTILWTPTGTYTPVEIQYSTDGFVTPKPVATVTNSASGVQGSYSWAIPDDISDTMRVRVRDPNDHDVNSVSAFDAKILGGLSSVFPNSGVVWYKGQSKNITWTANGTVSNVKIEYKTSAGGGYTTIVADDGGHTAGGNTYTWTQVADENSEDSYIRVSDVNHLASVYAVSASAFSIRPLITVTQPALNTNLRVGNSYTNGIQWSLNGSTKVTAVDLNYSTGGINGTFDKIIATGVDATLGQYTWTNVADTISNDVVIKISDKTGGTGNPNVFGLSPDFKILGSVVVNQPNASSDWQVGATDKNITWTYTGSIGDVNIYYDYGIGYQPLAAGISRGTNGAGSWNWPSIPDHVSNTVKVKVTEAANESTVYGESATFKIKGSFVITDPVGGTLYAGQGTTITWNKVGTDITNVNLQFSSDNGQTWSDIGTNPHPNTGSLAWTVPANTNSSTCLIRISDPNNVADTQAVSASTFEIRAIVNVTSPTAASEWTVGTTQNIGWNITGVVQNVKIDYSKNGGTDWSGVTTSYDATLSPYSWAIPTTGDLRTPDQATIKVSDASNAVVYGASPNFRMKGVIAVTRPNTNDILKVGDGFNITWTTQGFTGGNVIIVYSTTGAAPFTNINTVAYNYGSPAGTYSWAAPIDSITSNLKKAVIEIQDANDATKTKGDSDLFEIEGKIRLDSPNLDAPTWHVGDIQQIKWTPTGSFNYVKIEYSTNGFSDESQTTVEAGTYSNSASGVQGTYAWTIPDKIGSNLKVRISAKDDPETVDVSASPFVIKGSIVISAPNGGETWYVGDTNHQIKWQANGTIPTVRIEYSKNNGGLWTEIISNASAGAGAGQYTWPSVPDAISDQCLMRVSDTNDSTVKSVSSSVFSIKGKISVTSPDASTRWVAQSSNHPITWNITGSIQNVKIEYAVDGGNYNNVIVSSTSASNGTYTWNNLPSHVSSTYKIKVSDANDPTNVFGESELFKIVGSVAVTVPNGTEQLKVGSNFKIQWTEVGDFANARIEYSTNGGTSYDYQIVDSTPAANLFYFWNNIPATTVSPNVKIKITDANDIQTFAESPLFKIQGILTMASPVGGEVWVVNSSHDITWTTVGNILNVKLDYSTDSGQTWTVITTTPIANTGTKSWTIPDTITTFARVRVTDANDPNSNTMSAGDFKIRGDLLITSPTNGTESWLVGSTQPITWQVTGSISKVKLEFSVDGAAYQQVPNADNLDATSSPFNWQIPDSISSQVNVKITNKDDSTVYTQSANNFSITGQLTLTSPLGGETWYVQDQQSIAWTKTGTIPAVNLQYSVSGGAYTDITDAQNLTGSSFAWVIPDAVSSQVKVKAINSNATKPTIPGVSGFFTVKGKLTIINPTSGIVWGVGLPQNITWNRIGSVGDVKLEYNYGTGFIQIPGAESIASSLQTFSWNISDTISNNVAIRMTPLDTSQADVATSSTFTIAAGIQLTSPVGGEVWVVDDSQPITWVKRGTIANINIKYDTNEGLGGYPNTIATRPASDSSYSWQVPDAIGDKLRVRIEDAAVSNTRPSASSANFAIRGSITVTQPAGIGLNEQVWLSTSSQNINYTIHGSIANVEIRYSVDGGTTYPDNQIIAPSVPAGPGNLSYRWSLPASSSTHAKIKVTALGAATVYGESDEFIIRGGFTIAHPASGERWLATSAQLIAWSTFGNIPNVYLQYTLDNGNNWSFVVNGLVSNTGSYSWTLPSAISNQARVKITDVNDPNALTISDMFTINGALSVTHPNGQEKFKAGESDPSTQIQWTMVGPIAAVDLALSTNGQNGTYTTFATNKQASLLSYQWTVPNNVISNNCFIRINDSNDNLVVATSALPFKIMDNLVLTAPNGGEQWTVGTQQNITWSSFGLAPAIDIAYSIEPTFTQWQPIASNVPNGTNGGSYQWTIPPTVSVTSRVRINAYINGAEDTDSVAISNNNFIIKGNITLVAPNGGTPPNFTDKEKWGSASQQWIRWTWVGNIDKVDIHYYTGSTWVAIDEAQGISNSGEYQWTIPLISTTNALVRVRQSDVNFRDTVFDTSHNPFKIMPRVVMTAPNGGEVWYAGSNSTITWSSYGPSSFDTVQIDYSINDPTFTSPQSITTSTANNSTFAWNNIPAEAVSGKVRVRVAKPDDIGDVNGISNGDFRVRANFTLNTPNGGQKWVVGSGQTISWNQIGNTTGVKFTVYKQTNPAINQTFTDSTPHTTGTWSYNWTIPDFINSDLIMKVEDPNDNGAFNVSQATFKIIPGFTVTLPNASSQNDADHKWYVGDPAAIAWTYTGTVDQVGIYYSTTGGIEGSWVSLSSASASDLQWTWATVPDQITAQLKIKVGAANDADAYGVSQGMSKIRAKFTLSKPSGGEELVVGDPFTIMWSNIGTVNKVDLQYSLDNFSTTKDIQLNLSNSGSYNWTVPDDISHTVQVRVKSSSDVDAYAISPAFRIKGKVWVKAPTLNTGWEIGQGKAIEWGWVGTIPTVKITYSLQQPDSSQGPYNPILENDGTPNDGIVTNGTGSGGANSDATYTWTIPDQANNNVLLNIADARTTESDVQATSDAFKIIGYLIIKAPAGGEKLSVTSTFRIRWEWGGTMPQVGITLSTNGFADENQNFDVGTVSNGSGAGGPGSESYYDWTVPDHISPNCKIRIYDPRITTVNSVSPQFKIQGAFTILTPAVQLDSNNQYQPPRWVVNEIRPVTWTTFGTINNVDLTYAKDINGDSVIDATDWAQEIPMANGTNTSNTGTFNWSIPNERTQTPPFYVNVRVRVYDHNDHDVFAEGPTPQGGVNAVKIDYYKITWDIRDLVTNQPIQGLSVNDTSGLDVPPYYTNWVAQGLASPVSHYVRAGNWHAEWSQKDYGPIAEDYLVGWDPDAHIWRGDRTIFRTMETLVVHIWRAYSDFSYDTTADRLDITSWLERDGALVPGALLIDVGIYDGSERIKRKTVMVDETNNKHLFYTDIPDTVQMWIGTRLDNTDPNNPVQVTRTMADIINDAAPYKTGEEPIPASFAGFFTQSWSPTNYTSGGVPYTKLQSGKVYAVVGNALIATGASFKTPVSFSVTIPATLDAVQKQISAVATTVTSMLDKPISQVDNNLRKLLAGTNANPDDIAAQGGIKGIVEKKLDDQTQIIKDVAKDMLDSFDKVLTSFEKSTQEAVSVLQAGADTAKAAGETLKKSAEKFSWKVTVAPNPALTGDTVTLTCSGLKGKLPMLDIYSWDNKIIKKDTQLTESSPGVYSYSFKADSRFTPGKSYTFTITESTTDAFITGSASVESMGLTTIAGLASAAPEAARAAKNALEEIKKVESVLLSGDNVNIAVTLKSLKDSVEALPAAAATIKENSSPVIGNTINEISDRLKKLSGSEGLDFNALFEKAMSGSPTLKEMRMKTEEINSVIDILMKLFEAKFGGKEAPVVSTSIQSGSIVFQIVAANPSKFKTQKVPVKLYLPAEAKAKDIMDNGGLDVEYDSEKNRYYVYKNEVELKPTEIKVFKVEVEDIWLVNKAELDENKQRVDIILSKLGDTEYYTRAKEIANTIYPRLETIAALQSDEAMSRERHIGIYRENQLTLAQIKDDIAKMEKILVTAGGPPAPEMLAKTKIKAEEPSKTMTWIVIFIIIIFVGLLATVLFFTWHSQTRLGKEELLSAKRAAFPESEGSKGKESKKEEPPPENNKDSTQK